MKARETNDDKNLSLQTFRSHLYAAWSRGVALVGQGLVTKWNRSWNDSDARSRASKRFARERVRVLAICEAMREGTSDSSSPNAPIYDPRKQTLWLDKDVREHLLALRETPARVWFDSKRKFASHLREGMIALQVHPLEKNDLFDEDQAQLEQYAYWQTPHAPLTFLVSAGAEVTQIGAAVGESLPSDPFDDDTSRDNEEQDSTADNGLALEAGADETIPLVQTFEMLNLLAQLPAKPEHMRHSREEYFFEHGIVRAVCTGFFEQRIGDFARDFDHLDRAGMVMRKSKEIGMNRPSPEAHLLLPDRPGALLLEFIEWIRTNSTALGEDVRTRFVSQAVRLYVHHGWINRAIDLVVLAATSFSRDAMSAWRLAYLICERIRDRRERGRCFRLITFRLITQAQFAEADITSGIGEFVIGERYDYVVDIALECHRLGRQATARSALGYALKKIDDEELRTIRPIVPKDMVDIAMKHPARGIPREWCSMPRILVMEENLDFRVLLNAILRRLHHEVFLTSSVSEGLARLEDEPDVILVTDIMADTTGMDFLAYLRDHAPGLIPRTIVFTTHPTITDALEASMVVFPKPIDVMELVKTIHDLPRSGVHLPDAATFAEAQAFARRVCEKRYANSNRLHPAKH